MEEINAKKNIWKAIRKKCLECSGGYTKEADNCVIKACALYPYRMGKPLTTRKRVKKDA